MNNLGKATFLIVVLAGLFLSFDYLIKDISMMPILSSVILIALITALKYFKKPILPQKPMPKAYKRPLKINKEFEVPAKSQSRGSNSPLLSADKPRFLKSHETSNIHGYETGGLVYVGSIHSPYHKEQPSLLNPDLTIDKSIPVDSLGYWPNYTTIHPNQRHQYLVWLSTGRGWTVESGNVFMFLYGLERYVLCDGLLDNSDDRHKNLSDIEVELHRLRQLFVDNKSFTQYTDQLLDVIYIKYKPHSINSRKSAFPGRPALAAQYAISQMASDGISEPLDSDWALQWLLSSGTISRTKMVRQHYSVLRALFKAVYDSNLYSGVIVPSCNTKLIINIKTSSNGLDKSSLIPVPEGWCDPTVLKSPLKKLTLISESVMPAFRALARSIERKDIAGIISSWPPGVPTDSIPKLKEVIASVSNYLDSNLLIEVNSLGTLLGMPIEPNISKTQAKKLASTIQSCGFSMVPDPLLMPFKLNGSDQICAYKGLRLSKLSSKAQLLIIYIRIGVVLASEKTSSISVDIESLKSILYSKSDNLEKQFLGTYLAWCLNQPTNVIGIKKQIANLLDKQRANLAKGLIELVMSNTESTTDYLIQLDKLFISLGLDNGLISEFIRDKAKKDKALKALLQSKQPINKASLEQPFVLDEKILKMHADSTNEIQSVLQEIFSEEPVQVESLLFETKLEHPNDNDTTWHGGLLDHSHEELATWLVTKSHWPMTDINDKCQNLGLLPDGALEQINNVAFDVLGDGLLELGDQVEVYHDVLPV
jgi:hypothetical protein